MDSSDFFAPGAPTLAKLGAAALAEFAILPAAELGLLLADPVYWGLGVPRGDRHSVLVLPGLFAGDGYLQPLRRWLWRVDYTPLRSGLKRNPGWSPEVVHELGELAQGGLSAQGPARQHHWAQSGRAHRALGSASIPAGYSACYHARLAADDEPRHPARIGPHNGPAQPQ